MENARKVYYYWRMYQHFLLDNNLEDDSQHITVDDLVKYIEENLSVDERNHLWDVVLEMY